VYLPTGNRSGSVKCLNLATGAFVTRDTFKVVPTTTTTIKIMNDLAALDGRHMAKMSPATHDLIYNQSVAKTNNPTFLPVQLSLRDMGTLALIPDNPNPAVPLVLSDTRDHIPAGPSDIVPHDEGVRLQ
jgi:hypothetical protein